MQVWEKIYLSVHFLGGNLRMFTSKDVEIGTVEGQTSVYKQVLKGALSYLPNEVKFRALKSLLRKMRVATMRKKGDQNAEKNQ